MGTGTFVPRRSTVPRFVLTTLLWPVGMGLTSWQYMWRTTPMHRRELEGTIEADSPPPLPPELSDDGLQLAEDGAGDLYHRRYRARFADPRLSARELVARLLDDPNPLVPVELARFTKVAGGEGPMQVNDEYVVQMPGPWDGPVRVAEVTPTGFRVVTLEGHLEAGQIAFSAADEPGTLVFQIESWARSGDRLVELLYDHLRMAKEVQLHMWTSALENVGRLSGGRRVSGIDIETRRVEYHEGEARSPLDPQTRSVLDALRQKTLNFDLNRRHEFTPERGWNLDEYRQPLPPEPPGAPVPGGSWDVARRLVRDYRFADPEIVQATYDGEGSLEERDMLLEARWHGLRFHLGVRVGGVVDETREVDGRAVRVWGWNYRTLQGHLEMGQMDYELWKWLDTGEVEFRISAFSRPAPDSPWIVRLGFRLFGRAEQVRFARRACERMARLTAAALEHGDVDQRRVPAGGGG